MIFKRSQLSLVGGEGPVRPREVCAQVAAEAARVQVAGAEGPTLFMFTEMTYTNQRGEVVVKGKNTYIKY